MHSRPLGRNGVAGLAQYWLPVGAWVIVDQGCFSLANLGIQLVLARALTREQFGVFGLLANILVGVGIVHAGIFVEPMLVFGASTFQEVRATYCTGLARWTITFALVVGLLVSCGFGFALALFRPDSAISIGGFISLTEVTSPVLLFALLRRMPYLEGKPVRAALGSATYLSVVLFGLHVISSHGTLRPEIGIALMGLGAAIAAVVLAGLERMRLGSHLAGRLRSRAVTLHLSYGRWAVASGLLGWAPISIVIFSLPAFAGLEELAMFRATYNVALPALLLFGALGGILLPVQVRALAGGRAKMVLLFGMGSCAAIALAYAGVVLLFGPRLMQVMYGGRYMAQQQGTWVWLAVTVLAFSLEPGLASFLRGIGRPRHVMWSNAAYTAAVLTLGVPLIARLGAPGGLIAMMIGSLSMTLVLACFTYRALRTSPVRAKPLEALRRTR